MAWSQLNLTICHLSTPYAYMAFWRGLHCRVIEEALGRSRTRLYGAPGASGGRSKIGRPDLAKFVGPPAHRIQAADCFHDFLPWQSIAAEQIGDVTEKWRFQRSVQKASQNPRDLWKTAQPARRADDDVIEALAAPAST